MRKSEIIEGLEYGYSSYANGSLTKVRVLENDVYHVRSARTGGTMIPRDTLRATDQYIDVHLKWALCEAFPEETTPRERREVQGEVQATIREINREWLAADPMRRYARGEGYGRYNEHGILCMKVDRDGNDAGRVLVPRRHIRKTWHAHLQDQRRAAVAQREARAASARREQELARKRPLVRKALEEAGVSVYVGDYSTDVSLSFDQFLQVVRAAAVSAEVEVSA